jgi:hypothetical protein
MAILATGNTFATGDSVTATMLNNAVNNATFDTGSVDSSTTQLSGGAIIVKDGGITAAKLSTGGPTWTSGGALTATSIQNSPIGSSTPASGAFTSLSANSTSSFYEIIEKAGTIGTALGGTVNFNFLDRAINYYTVNSTSNWTLNVRGDASTTLDSLMSTGVVSKDCVSIVVMATNGSTAYCPDLTTPLTIDGNAVTPKWAGGTAPTAGNANSVDIYTFTIIKTASATFTVFATQTKFA